VLKSLRRGPLKRSSKARASSRVRMMIGGQALLTTHLPIAKRIDASQAYVSQVEHGKGLSVEQLRLFTDALEEEAKGDEEDAGKKRERKRTRGT
jgi:hypothetical protein